MLVSSRGDAGLRIARKSSRWKHFPTARCFGARPACHSPQPRKKLSGPCSPTHTLLKLTVSAVYSFSRTRSRLPAGSRESGSSAKRRIESVNRKRRKHHSFFRRREKLMLTSQWAVRLGRQTNIENPIIKLEYRQRCH
jgi:hypothetical protein